VSATTPPPSSEPETTPEEYRQRALLFADLGRYADATEEIAAGLAAAPTDAGLLATLARVHLVADQPAEALVAAERAVAAAPGTINPLVVRAMALADSTRYSDAARDATDVLRRWPEDPYAQRTGAALLSESRNGQDALNAAWNGVRVAPSEAEAHLVLAVVAARLRLFDLAQRAYGEALDLDSEIGNAQCDVGIVRLERRRWARALENLADEASLDPSGPPAASPPEGRNYPSPFPRPYQMPGPSDTSAVGETPDFDAYPDPSPEAPPRRFRPGRPGRPLSDTADGPARRASDVGGAATSGTGRGWFEPPVRSILDSAQQSAETIRQAALFGANATLIAAVMVAVMTIASSGASRVWAGMVGALLFVAVPIWLSRRLTGSAAAGLSRLRTDDRPLAITAYAALFAPLLVVLYAVVGGSIPLVVAMLTAATAELIILIRRR
jgi:tetratricopeptide (TPR) repeat protein